MSRHLQIFGIRFTWNERKKTDARGQTLVIAVDPALDPSILNDAGLFLPITGSADTPDASNLLQEQDRSIATLTHLKLLPGWYDKSSQERTPPLLVAIFSYVRNTVDTNQAQQADCCVLSYLELHTTTPTLHATFHELDKKAKLGKPESSLSRLMLSRKADVVLSNNVLAFSTLQFNTILALTLTDGSTIFRHRASMDVIEYQEGADQIENPPQTGFVYPSNGELAALHSVFAPNGCITADLDSEGKIKLRRMELAIEWSNEKQPEQPIIALAAQFMIAVWYSWNNDDVLAVLPRNTTRENLDSFIRTIITGLNVTIDYATDEAQKNTFHIFRFSTFAKCLSAQNVLANDFGKERKRSLMGKLAWATLNLRGIATFMGITMQNTKTPNLNASSIEILSGQTKYMLDMLSYILDELFNLASSYNSSSPNRDAVVREVHSMNPPALHLVLHSIPRHLIRFTIQYLRLGHTWTQQAIDRTSDPKERRIFRQYLSYFDNAPFNFIHFLALIDEVEAWIKRLYTQPNFSDDKRTECEKAMLLNAEIPETLMPAVHRMLTITIEQKLKNEVDPAKLYFHDVRWLGLTDDRASKQLLQEEQFDVHTKNLLAPDARVRKCMRCGSLLDDEYAKKSPVNAPFSIVLEKSCICAANWMWVPAKE
jgi:mediator of RNA polymerase II transcription subunit 16, fungi type